MTTPLPSGILEALRIVPGAPIAEGRTFQELTLLDLTLPHETEDGVLTNRCDLLCPRGCRSIILKRGVGKLIERSGIEVRPMDMKLCRSERQLCIRWIPLGIPLIPLWLRFRHHLRRCNGGLLHPPRWSLRMLGFLDLWFVRETW